MEWLWAAVAIFVFGVPAMTIAWIFSAIGEPQSALWYALTPIVAFAYLFLAVVASGLLSMILPAIPTGTYPLGRSSAIRRWLLRYGIVNYLRLPGLTRLIFANPLLRQTYLRLHGAHVDRTARLSYDIHLLDPSLVTIGPNSKVGAMVTLFGHFSDEHGFVFGPIAIGSNVLIGGHTLIGPNVVLNNGCVVQGGSHVLPGTVVPSGEVWGGTPARFRKMVKASVSPSRLEQHVTAI
jgi:acetyltransferase-like isoleucine patch superfamily enzyme